MRQIVLALLCAALAACGLIAGGDKAGDAQLAALFAQLSNKPKTPTPPPLSRRAIWGYWADGGSPTVNTLLERASAAAAAGDADLANRFIDEAVDLAPDYAEAGTAAPEIAYAAEDYAGALSSIQETLRRELPFRRADSDGAYLRRTGPAARRSRLSRRACGSSAL